MSRLVWNDPSTRFYEIGVSDAAVYLPDGRVAPWNGLISVKENPAGGELSSYYLDGDVYYNHVSPEDYRATVEAFTYPPELDSAMGIETGPTGIQYPGQERHTFGLVYKTQVGSALGSSDYKIHIVYGATLAVSNREYSTIGDSPEPTVFSWELASLPVAVSGRRAVPSIVMDSRRVNSMALAVLDGYLLGANGLAPRLPQVSAIETFLAAWPTAISFAGRVNFLGYFENPPTNLPLNPFLGDFYIFEGYVRSYRAESSETGWFDHPDGTVPTL